jgi:hypothetical protein
MVILPKSMAHIAVDMGKEMVVETVKAGDIDRTQQLLLIGRPGGLFYYSQIKKKRAKLGHLEL